MTDPLLQKMADEKKARDKEFLAKLAERRARDEAHYARQEQVTYTSQLRDDEKQAQAARAMLAALKEVIERPRHSTENADWWGRVYAAIAQAEAAGIKA